MTDSSEFEDPTDKTTGEERPEEPELRGRYVKGDYGTAGTGHGRHTDDEEGHYTQGDFGDAGSEGGLPEPLGSKAKEAGRFVKGDYDRAGTAGGRTAESEVGRYTEGDYGRDGIVDPKRKGATGTEKTSGPDGPPTT
ncbi:hypothetical protein J7E83_14885 [Arthrobacter sp. ISL-48]|uniref:hypothetical protein n=1 Tax=Arthrobacter sp. ISL-48 TaxID=2819110 RepID=UPI001BE6E54F|nr:hypothetical protein [Arthrobacter sp. ISL-48]MBT2533381.1 hypothetical protein [Arthrobacter sp. ISL-48]